MKKIICLISIVLLQSIHILTAYENHDEIRSLKNEIGGASLNEEEIKCRIKDDYSYSEISTAGLIPNSDETDIIKIYDYDGLRYMFFHSYKYKKHFLYYWEITKNRFLSNSRISLGLSYSEVVALYGKGHHSSDKYISYYFDDGALFFYFDENLSLVEIYWSYTDDM